MSDLDELEQLFLSQGGDQSDTASLPATQTDRQTHLDNARRLIDQLDSADNNVVKMQKRRVIRAELNAVRQMDRSARAT